MALGLTTSEKDILRDCYLYSAYGMLGLLLILTLVFFNRKGVFSALIYYLSYIQFIFLSSDYQDTSEVASVVSKAQEFFIPYKLFSAYPLNFVENCTEELILATIIITSFIIRQFLVKSDRKNSELITLLMFIIFQDYFFYALINLKNFSYNETLDIVGASLAGFYFLVLTCYLSIILWRIKQGSKVYTLLIEDFDKSEQYYLALLFEFLIVATLAAFLEDYYVVKISLITATEAGISNLYIVLQVFLMKSKTQNFKFAVIEAYHINKLIVCVFYLLNYYNLLSSFPSDYTFIGITLTGLITAIFRVFPNTAIQVNDSSQIDKTLEIQITEKNEKIVDGKPTFDYSTKEKEIEIDRHSVVLSDNSPIHLEVQKPYKNLNTLIEEQNDISPVPENSPNNFAGRKSKQKVSFRPSQLGFANISPSAQLEPRKTRPKDLNSFTVRTRVNN